MTISINYDYADVPTVRNFALSNKFIRGLMGPFGSGKSSGCVMEIIRRAKEQVPGKDGIRRSRWVAVRNTYRQLQDTTIRTFHDWIPPQYFGQWRAQDHDYIITQIPGCHIEILFRALDRPDQVSNLLSLEVTGAWINEAREVPKAIFEAVQGRVGRFPAVKDGGCTWAGIIMDTNPPDTDSWWYRNFEESLNVNGELCNERLCPTCKVPAIKDENIYLCKTHGQIESVECNDAAYHVFNRNTDFQQAYCKTHTNIALFKQPSGLSRKAENKRFLRENYYTNLARGKDPEYIKVYINGDYGFVMDGRPVYHEYADAIHCQEIKSLPKSTVYVGIDFGLTPAAVYTQMSPTGQWLVLDELCAEDMGIDRFSDQMLQFQSQHYRSYTFEYFADPAGNQKAQTDEKTCYQILASKGIYVAPGEQDLTIRLESVRKPLTTLLGTRPGLLVSPRCKTLRKGFQGGYQFRRLQMSQERYTEQPDKNEYSHPHDALQYVATRLFGNALRIALEHPETKERYARKRHSAPSWKTA